MISRLFRPLLFFSWLWLHPQRWRNWARYYFPEYQGDFLLTDTIKLEPFRLRFKGRRKAGTWLLENLFAPPLWVAGFVMLVTAGWGLPDMWERAGLYTLVVGILGSFLGAVTVSIAFGVVAGVVGAASMGLAAGFMASWEPRWLLPWGIFSISLAASVMFSLSSSDFAKPSLSFSSIFTGLLHGFIGIVGAGLLLWIGGVVLPNGLPHNPFWNSQLVGLSLAAGVGWGISSGHWRSAITLTLIWALLLNTAFWFKSSSPGLVTSLVGSASNTLLFSMLFILPYQFTTRLAGARAGIFAGIVGTSVMYLWFASPNPWLWAGCGIAMMAGVSRHYWQPIILWPIESSISLILLHRDQSTLNIQYLPWHPVFWDKRQPLPLYGLGDHLVLALCREHRQASYWLRQVMESPQQWAARFAWREFMLQRMESVVSLTAIQELPLPLPIYEFRTIHERIAKTPSSPQTAVTWLSYCEETLQEQMSRYWQGSDHLEVRRYGRIASRWRARVADALARHRKFLAKNQKLNNPYYVGIPLTSQMANVFVGRERECETLEYSLSKPGSAILLYGQQRMGKTSLLFQLPSFISPIYLPLYVDLQSIATAPNENRFFFRLAKAMYGKLMQSGNCEQQEPMEKYFAEDPFEAFDEWLKSSVQANSDRVLLFLLDEFNSLSMQFSPSRLSGELIMGYFRHLIQHAPRLRIIMASNLPWQNDPLLQAYQVNVEIITLRFLDALAARRLIEDPVPELRYTSEAITEMVTLTRGHPTLLQLFCARLIIWKNQLSTGEQRLTVSLPDVVSIIPDVLTSGAGYLAHFLQNSWGQKTILRALARANQFQWVPREQLKYECKIEENLFNDSLTNLLHREVIEQSPQGYRFMVELIRRKFTEY